MLPDTAGNPNQVGTLSSDGVVSDGGTDFSPDFHNLVNER